MPINKIHTGRKIFPICSSLIQEKQIFASLHALFSSASQSFIAVSIIFCLFLAACGGGGSSGSGPEPVCGMPDSSCVFVLGEKNEEISILHHSGSIDSVEKTRFIPLQLMQAGNISISESTGNYTITISLQEQGNEAMEPLTLQGGTGVLRIDHYLNNGDYVLAIEGAVGDYHLTIEFLRDSDKDGLVDREDTRANIDSAIPCRLLSDCDADGIADAKDTGEFNSMPCRIIPHDCDRDGVVDVNDTRSFDGIPCKMLADCDKDGMADAQDTEEFNGIPCRIISTDCDGDGLADVYDTESFNGTDCKVLMDCDADGLMDVMDIASVGGTPCRILADCDADGLMDVNDTASFAGTPCKISADCDRDGVADINDTASFAGTPCKISADCDSDGLMDQ